MPKIYDIDYNRLVTGLIPTFLRKKIQFEWITSLVRPVRVLYIDFKKFKSDSIYKVSHNSQLFSIKNVLNDNFDPLERRVHLEDAFEGQILYTYSEAENQPVYVYSESESQPVYVYSESFFTPSETDFLVIVPKDLKPSNIAGVKIIENQIKKQVDYYKLASKRYEIVWM